MKVAVFTIWHCGNYGAEMQAYATVKALRSIGCDVEIIDCPLSNNIPRSLKHRLGAYLNSLTPASKAFVAFWSENFPKSRRYYSIDDLRNDPPKADVYLVGSDQVWNHQITEGMHNVFYLDFGPKDVRRVSYASSFGISKWVEDPKYTAYVHGCLSRFAAIACREKTGVKLMNTVFNLGATMVLDPTLLFDDYSELVGNVSETNTLAYYSLDPLVKNELDDYVPFLAEQLGLSLKECNHITCYVHNRIWSRTSIYEWLKTIAAAKLVVTPSFHGLAFSLIFNRQFIIVQPENTGRSSRIVDLLSELGLSDRFFTSIKDVEESKIWERPIDYNSINGKLAGLRQLSFDYLKKAVL